MKPPQSNVVLRAVRILIPQYDRFIGRFCKDTGLIVPAATVSLAPVSGHGLAAHYAAEIGWLEEAADQVRRETVLAIHRAFVIPFERSQILNLITALDDTIHLLKDSGRHLVRGGVGFTPTMEGVADYPVPAATVLSCRLRAMLVR